MKISSHVRSSLMEDCTVVIRSVGERTTDWCVSLANSIFNPENVVVIDERPLHKAIRKAYEIGLDRNKTWTLEIDADILLRREGILQLVQTASEQPSSSFFHFGMVFDKLTNGFRSAGNKVLRTSHIPHALKLLPKAEKEVRPDTFIRKSMAKNGYHYYRDVTLIGIHDFEQDFFDLYRKGYLQGVKNRNKLERFVGNWPKDWSKDSDYVTIKAGMDHGVVHKGVFSLDPSFFENGFSDWKEGCAFNEYKEPLINSTPQIDRFIERAMPPLLLKEFEQKCKKHKYQYHVRSDANYIYRMMKILSRLQQRVSRM